ncbi:MAG TPA: helix-turn-helix transcriptional regulator [Saprospiraceae bacterium]|nr:helix-turn-helix transcriptional regulator [Saprospiraceae bacterium]HMQ85846.1 helix-turn-helix transcriptional regulator [Saprospiraceae bacterium]
MLRTLPQTFYEDPNIHKILVDGLSCAVHKKLEAAVYGKEGYISTHAITMILQGTLRVENDDGLFEEVPADHMVLLPKGIYTVSDILPKGGCFEALMFFFEPDVIQQFLDSLHFKGSKAKSVSHAVIKGHADTRFFADSLLRLYVGGQAGSSNRQMTKMKLFEFLHLINRTFTDQERFPAMLASLNNKERKSLSEFMLSNFHKPLAIEDYAYLTGRSVSTFTRDFKTRFNGVAPKQWLIERRLEKAHDLLIKKPVNSISDVAWESGYSNVPHFIKAFNKRFGITPKQFSIENRIKNAG